jgi:MATE family multidrug resistance protein
MLKDKNHAVENGSRETSSFHPFLISPHKTLVRLSLPVLLSLIAEPITGLVDTAFIARLGSAPLAALGAGTMALSSIFWAFNFLGIGTQTEVAQALGGADDARAQRMASLAIFSGSVVGVLLIGVLWPLASTLAGLMGAADAVHGLAADYIRGRLFGAPAVFVTIAAFGVFRGCQDMRTPLWVTIIVNLLNIFLDPLMIYGYGRIPALGVAGAAWASVISQWAGAVVLVVLIHKRIGWSARIRLTDVGKLVRIGRDLFIRTGLLTLFLLLATRAATQLGPDTGAAHQAIRQLWVLTVLFLDAFAVSGQSLVAYFAGARQLRHALDVARVVCAWSLATGVGLAMLMWLGRPVVMALFVPAAATSQFVTAWYFALLVQPVNALAFATDGIHWGTGDFRFLRNAVVVSTMVGVSLLLILNGYSGFSLDWIWAITGVWILVRAVAGVMRIWPGMGKSPLRGPVEELSSDPNE